MSYRERSAQRQRNHSARKPNRRNYRNKNSTINPSRFVNKATASTEETEYKSINSFSDFDLNGKTKATLEYLGFILPTPIQDQCIPIALKGEDVIGLANTGTGKTAAFTLPIIEKVAKSRAAVSTLILAPTRELAQQIDVDLRRFAEGQKVYSTLVVGGSNIYDLIRVF